MRIAMITSVFPLPSETFVVRQLAGLVELGHRVDVLTLRFGSVDHASPLVASHRLLARRIDLRKDGLPGLAGCLGTALRAPRASLMAIAASRRPRRTLPAVFREVEAVRRLRDREYDVVHAAFGLLGKRFAFAGPLLGARLVVSFRGSDFHLFPHRYGRRMYSSMFAQAHAVTVVSANGRQMLSELGCPAHKLVRHGEGIDPRELEFRERRPRPGAPTDIITVARLVEVKRLDRALEVVARLVRAGHDVRYRIVGDGPERARLEATIDELELAGTCELTGPVDSAELVRLLERSHIFLLTSDAEGLPVVLLEAQASGLPVVSTDVGGVAEAIVKGASGHLAAADDIAGLAGQVATLIEHPELWPVMGRAGRAHVEANFDIRSLCRRLEGIYSNVVAGLPPG